MDLENSELEENWDNNKNANFKNFLNKFNGTCHN